jgi:hypothetical protein
MKVSQKLGASALALAFAGGSIYAMPSPKQDWNHYDNKGNVREIRIDCEGVMDHWDDHSQDRANSANSDAYESCNYSYSHSAS